MDTNNKKVTTALHACSKEELLSLLCQYELQLQLREHSSLLVAGEKLLADVPINGPLSTLLRDAEHVVEEGVWQKLPTATQQDRIEMLERLVLMQGSCQRKCQRALDTLERRHAKALTEVDSQRSREERSARRRDAQLAAAERAKIELESKLAERDSKMHRLQDELLDITAQLEKERSRTRRMVLYLILERSKLLARLNSPAQNGGEDRKEVQFLRNTRNKLLAERREMQEKIARLEEDLNLLKDSILCDSTHHYQSDSIKAGSLIVVNRGAIASSQVEEVAKKAATARGGVQPSSSFPSSFGSSSSHRGGAARSEVGASSSTDFHAIAVQQRKASSSSGRGDVRQADATKLPPPKPTTSADRNVGTLSPASMDAGPKVGGSAGVLSKRSSSLPMKNLEEGVPKATNPAPQTTVTPSRSSTATKNRSATQMGTMPVPATKPKDNKQQGGRPNGMPSHLIKRVPFLMNRRKDSS